MKIYRLSFINLVEKSLIINKKRAHLSISDSLFFLYLSYFICSNIDCTYLSLGVANNVGVPEVERRDVTAKTYPRSSTCPTIHATTHCGVTTKPSCTFCCSITIISYLSIINKLFVHHKVVQLANQKFGHWVDLGHSLLKDHFLPQYLLIFSVFRIYREKFLILIEIAVINPSGKCTNFIPNPNTGWCSTVIICWNECNV